MKELICSENQVTDFCMKCNTGMGFKLMQNLKFILSKVWNKFPRKYESDALKPF